MKAEQIAVSPFSFSRVMECQIEKEVGTHGKARIRGYISPKNEAEYLTMACGRVEVQLMAFGEEADSQVIYCGILEDLQITYKNSVCVMEIEVVPYSRLLDLVPVRRSFQIPATTYQQVLNGILAGYAGGDEIMNTGADVPIGEPIVQYQETDWEFIQRLASHFNTVVTPSYTTSGPKLYVGLVEWPGTSRINPVCYQAKKAVGEFLYKEQNKVEGIVEDDSLWYIVEDQELYEVGQMVTFRERSYYVARAESHLEGHQLWNRYYLKTLAGFKVPRYYNERIIGASLDGVVTAVSADVVRVRLGVDAGGGEGKWFSFSTVYSSPDGSGWYCMPEPGDEIRLYFPTEREKHGYVISAVHLPVAQTGGGAGTGSGARNSGGSSGAANPGACRCDPTHKTIHTVSNKMVDLAETYILLDAGNGMTVRLDDNTGITITSPSTVTIESGGSIDIASLNGSVEVVGKSGVNIMQDGSKVELASNNVIIAGANAKVQ